jgi:hypothetical protein
MLHLAGHCGGATAAPASIASVHARLWLIERRCRTYFWLADVLPGAQAAMMQLLQVR